MSNKQIILIDCQVAGIAGNMLVGALLDLGADMSKVTGAMEAAKDFVNGCNSIDVVVKDIIQRGFRAKEVNVVIDEEFDHRTGLEIMNAVKNCVDYLNLSDKASEMALGSIRTLMEAEVNVHGSALEDVHLHELGSADTVADIVGAVTALEDLVSLKDTLICSTAVAVGGGLIKISHGIVPVPSPATLEILRSRNFPMIGGPVEAELTTPTGASLLVNLTSKSVQFYPMMQAEAVGFGAGGADLEAIPNIVRVILGKPSGHDFLSDEIYVLETNVDNVTGEVIGHVVEKLSKAGGREVCVIPVFTKKNRPGHIIKAIVSKEDVGKISHLMMEELGTLGVRVLPCYTMG
ncbi:MAG: nickel pincer cofactor biosynthesis protein LarC [Methanocellales archaeon]|nr:nickel pincer cofactor biosynthesis protein LarC [Methanocellales archaeon]MDD3421439.1 nickel pincer cofactor biosynthesis protein LarC [Methanocellales archaeon]MDD4898343.1 nickel pincer cofactor biosynthesis protein LarC [Methanocellales archaeon]MDD5446650.1 nickel pincer cofactor biosynthesis protein LarC [Methanocellales archaeon]